MVSEGSDFEFVQLGSVCAKIGSGATPRGGNHVYFKDGPCALIRSQNVYNGGFHCEGLVFIDKSHAHQLRNVEVMRGDILLNITGDSVARCCQVDPKILPARVNQHVAIIRPESNKLDPKFLRYYLISPDVQAKLLLLAGSGATRPALTKAMIESLIVQAPKDVAEQRAIASILGALDDKIELNRQMNHTLEKMAQALFQSWFVDFDPVWAKKEGRQPFGMDADTAALFPDDFEESELGLIPAGWSVQNVSDVCRFEYGKSLKAELRRCGEIPVYGSNGQIGLHNQALVKGPGIIVGRKGNPGTVTWSSSDFFPIDTTFYVEPTLPVKSMHFIFYWLRTFAFSSLNSDSAIPGLNRNMAYMEKGVVPNVEAIQVFDRTVRPLKELMEINARQHRTLESIRDALLPKLLSGELRVPVDAENVDAQEVTLHDA